MTALLQVVAVLVAAGAWLATRPPRPYLAKIFVANMGRLTESPDLLARIREGKPEVVALSEVPAHGRRWYRNIPGYRFVEAPMVDGDRSGVCLLVRKGILIDRLKFPQIRRRWWGPSHGRAHEGRAWIAARLIIDGRKIWVTSTHAPWGSQTVRNLPAWLTWLGRIEGWLENGANRLPFRIPRVVVGDMNQKPEWLAEWAQKRRWMFATVSGVTHVLGAGTGRINTDRVAPPKEGDAHGWGWVWVWPPVRRRRRTRTA